MNIDEVINNQSTRIELFKNSFSLFFAYHFGRDFAPFQIDWMEAMESDRNTFIEGFRASRKTTIAKGYIVWCIVYKRYDYIVWTSYDATDSINNVTDIAKMLFVDSIMRDYGQLFPLYGKKEDFQKKTQGNFDTTNQVKVQSKGLAQNTRGMNTFDMKKSQIKRPGLLFLDDVDVDKSVMNPRIIEENERKLLGQVFGALDPLRHKIVMLGNTILEDGIVPRFRKRFKEQDGWDVFHQPLIIDGENQRPEVFTDEVIERAKANGDISFGQNYLLIPYGGQGIIKREWIKYIPRAERYKSIIMGVDPASSTKTMSDPLAIVLSGENFDGTIDIIEAYELIGPEKEKDRVIQRIFNLYTYSGAKVVNFEAVNAYTYLSDDLKSKGIAVNNITPHKDKVTRVMEREADLKSGLIRFVDNGPGIDKLVTQLLSFPFVSHDDLVDAMIFSLPSKKKHYTI